MLDCNYPVDTEMEFSDYVDMLHRHAEVISFDEERSVLRYASIAQEVHKKAHEELRRGQRDTAYVLFWRCLYISENQILRNRSQLNSSISEVSSKEFAAFFKDACDQVDTLRKHETKGLRALHAQQMDRIKAESAQRKLTIARQLEEDAPSPSREDPAEQHKRLAKVHYKDVYGGPGDVVGPSSPNALQGGNGSAFPPPQQPPPNLTPDELEYEKRRQRLLGKTVNFGEKLNSALPSMPAAHPNPPPQSFPAPNMPPPSVAQPASVTVTPAELMSKDPSLTQDEAELLARQLRRKQLQSATDLGAMLNAAMTGKPQPPAKNGIEEPPLPQPKVIAALERPEQERAKELLSLPAQPQPAAPSIPPTPAVAPEAAPPTRDASPPPQAAFTKRVSGDPSPPSPNTTLQPPKAVHVDIQQPPRNINGVPASQPGPAAHSAGGDSLHSSARPQPPVHQGQVVPAQPYGNPQLEQHKPAPPPKMLRLQAPTGNEIAARVSGWRFNGPRSGPSQPRRGLVNLGNTCYMNSVLQCINTSIIGAYFVSPAYINSIAQSYTGVGKLAAALTFVLRELRTPTHVPASASHLKRLIGQVYDSFAGTSQQDASEFYRELTNNVHNDLNTEKDVRGMLPSIENHRSDDSDQKIAAQYWAQYKARDDSPLVNMVAFQDRQIRMCVQCQGSTRVFGTLMTLELPIPAMGRPISVEDCLAAYTRQERLTGDERPNCDRCMGKRDAVFSQSIFSLPKVLVLTLKRFRSYGNFSDKVNVEIGFQETLNLAPFMLSPPTDARYRLVGIVNHQGNMSGGHYTADCKGMQDGYWMHYSDEVMKPAEQPDFAKAYMLFYHRMM